MLATVGLGVSDSVYRIVAFVSVISGRGLKQHVFKCLHGFGAQAWSWQETVYHEE